MTRNIEGAGLGIFLRDFVWEMCRHLTTTKQHAITTRMIFFTDVPKRNRN